MDSTPSSLASTRQLPAKLTQIIDRFRQAWDSVTSAEISPDLSTFLRDVPDEALRREALVALVAVDLESHYRCGAGEQADSQRTQPTELRLEAYLETFPELGTVERLPIELIGDEYRVRHLWGDRPGREEYRERFPQWGEQLEAMLDNVETELRQQAKTLDGPPDTVDLSATTDELAATEAANGAARRKDVDRSPPAALRITEHFVFGAKLGEGGMGAVYSATDQLLGRTVAIKVVRPKWHADEDILQQFFREAQLASQLQHPGICPVYEVGLIHSPEGATEDPVPFIAMKQVEGKTLADALNENRDDERATRRRWLEVLGEVADAVGYAHERGVIHRDLKPANVMLGAHGETQVMDWGLAKFSLLCSPDGGAVLDGDADATQFGTVKGTWAYMPPEQATGRTDEIDARADVFATRFDPLPDPDRQASLLRPRVGGDRCGEGRRPERCEIAAGRVRGG